MRSCLVFMIVALIFSTPCWALAQTVTRVVVLQIGGDPSAAREHGDEARAAAEVALTRAGWVAAPSGACQAMDCAASLLEGNAAEWVLAIALWNSQGGRVAVSLMGQDGGVLNANAEASSDWTRAVNTSLTDVIAQAQGARQSQLSVTGTPAGASITVDQLPWGTLPHEASVSRGLHAIAVSADGYITERREVSIGLDANSLEINLTRSSTTPELHTHQPSFSIEPLHTIFAVVGCVTGLLGVGIGTIAFSNGGSADLSLPLTGWIGGGVVTIASTVWLLTSLGASHDARASASPLQVVF